MLLLLTQHAAEGALLFRPTELVRLGPRTRFCVALHLKWPITVVVILDAFLGFLLWLTFRRPCLVWAN